ncbi:polyamine aminopropyltransferase [Fodinibius saliphilus]|uniref:polyamine aminopropyltransferase n=1 Tax=Fodinibius saliphilus TaxID=1920650 RepID=UPI0011089C2A|nr:polyamine aminopropyltransferase [Fodinibius saliphilus]
MSSTFNEFYEKKTGLTVGIEEVLFSKETAYQMVEILETDSWGRMMTIDGMVMLSEKDEFVYHEMLTHVGLLAHPNPQRVLIIGGGDGGTAREVLRHPNVQIVDMVEIDEVVVGASKEFLSGIGDWDNPKLNIIIDDGIEYVNNIDDSYDVIIIDGSDPTGPAAGLFETSFIKACYDGLSEDGILTAQTESPWVESYQPSIKKIFAALDEIYEVSEMYLAHIPLYPAGMWSFSFASKGRDPLADEVLNRVEDGMSYLGNELQYYNPEIHRGCFALPGFVKEIIE